jgi:CheY-like chemotaxis protein
LPTWMVVEDEPDIYDVLLAMFEIWGIEGVAFVDGAEAITWIEDVDKGTVAGELPELAILDIRLPEVPGPEVGARLRRSDRLGKMAIVMITAYRLSPEEEEAVKARAQADALMYKPLPAMPELRKTLDQIITKRKTMPAPSQPVPASQGQAQQPPQPKPAAPPAPTTPSTRSAIPTQSAPPSAPSTQSPAKPVQPPVPPKPPS